MSKRRLTKKDKLVINNKMRDRHKNKSISETRSVDALPDAEKKQWIKAIEETL